VSPIPEHDAAKRLLRTLTSHDVREADVLDAYQRLADSTDDDGVRYLVQFLIEDEERHHRVITEMAHRVQAWIDHTQAVDGTPSITPHVDIEFLNATRQLIDLERRDAKELRELHRELRYAPATSLLPILVKLMLDDTNRHIEILRFLRAYTG